MTSIGKTALVLALLWFGFAPAEVRDADESTQALGFNFQRAGTIANAVEFLLHGLLVVDEVLATADITDKFVLHGRQLVEFGF